jgi:hypothetical protein
MLRFFRFLLNLSRSIFHWPPAPASVTQKHALVRHWHQHAQLTNFIETGTFKGNMVEAQRGIFSTIVTIELSDQLYEAARKRFAPYSHVHVLHGDSAKKLSEAIQLVKGPALFWLDAHYSRGITARGDKETPILQELATIATRHEPRDVILIDDARLFKLHPGYPRLARIRKFVAEHWPDHSFKVESDIICIPPAGA